MSKAKPLLWDEDSKTYSPCDVNEATHLWLKFPGPFENRILPITIGPKETTSQWLWNGDVEKPTLSPSIRTTNGTIVCHSLINDGMVNFCADSTHEFSGKTVELESFV